MISKKDFKWVHFIINITMMPAEGLYRIKREMVTPSKP